MTMTMEAGVTLKAAQTAAAEAGCLLPLSISSEGSAQIGGILATNAGGNNTVRYGNARDLVLGLEVVLPDGQVWNGLRRLHKDNTGYCLRQMFVGGRGHARHHHRRGAEAGARPREIVVALCAVPSAEEALELFDRFQRARSGCDAGLRIHVRARGPASCCATSPARRCRCANRRRLMCWWNWRRRAKAPVCARRWSRCWRRRWRRA